MAEYDFNAMLGVQTPDGLPNTPPPVGGVPNLPAVEPTPVANTVLPEYDFDAMVKSDGGADPDAIHHALRKAEQQNPEEMARRKKMGDFLKVNPNLLPSTPEAQAEVFRAQNDPTEIATNSPKTGKWLSKGDNAGYARDSIAKLREMEHTVTTKGVNPDGYLVRSFQAGAHNMAAVAGVLASALIHPFAVSDEDLAVLYKNDPEGFNYARERNIFRSFAREQAAKAKEVMNSLSSEEKAKYENLEYATTDLDKSALLEPRKVLGDILQSAPTTAAMMVMFFATRGASLRAYMAELVKGATKEIATRAAVKAGISAGTKVGAAAEGLAGYAHSSISTQVDIESKTLKQIAVDPQFRQLITDGYDPEMAQAFIAANKGANVGALTGAVDAAMSAVGGRYWGKLIGEGGSLFPRFGKGFLTEAAVEAPQSAGEQIVANLYDLDPSKQWYEGAGEAFVQGGVLGGLTGGTINTFFGGNRAAAEAENNHRVLTDLADNAAQTPLRARSAEIFSDFVGSMTDKEDVAEVYIDSKDLLNVMYQSGVNEAELRQKLPGVAAQLGDSANLSGSVAIPTADLLAQVQDPAVLSKLLEVAKVDPDGVSYAESQVFFQKQVEQYSEEAKRIQEEKTNDTEYKNKVNEVGDRIFEQIVNTGRYSKDAAASFMVPIRNFYVVNAKRFNKDPVEFYNENPYFATGEATDPRVVQSGVVSQSRWPKGPTATFDDFRAGAVKDIISKDDWAIVTSANPMGELLEKEENDVRLAELREYLDTRGYKYREINGKYGNEETSYIITGITPAEALAIVKLWNQESVLTRDGFTYQDGSIQPSTGDVTEFSAPEKDLYSWVTWDDGTTNYFRVEIDFASPRIYPTLAQTDVKAVLTDGSALPSFGEPRPNSVSVVGVHFSNDKRDFLSSKMFGRGISGRERDRVEGASDPRIKQRIYFYVPEGEGITPEAGVGHVAHAVVLNNLYDSMNDPLRIWKSTNDINARESKLLDAGYAGYYAEGVFGEQGAAVVLGEARIKARVLGSAAEANTLLGSISSRPATPNERRVATALLNSRVLPSGRQKLEGWRKDLMRLEPELYALVEKAGVFDSGITDDLYRNDLANLVLNPQSNQPKGEVFYQTDYPEDRKPFTELPPSYKVEQVGNNYQVRAPSGEVYTSEVFPTNRDIVIEAALEKINKQRLESLPPGYSFKEAKRGNLTTWYVEGPDGFEGSKGMDKATAALMAFIPRGRSSSQQAPYFQGNRIAAFDTETLTSIFMKGANLSSVIHESGHFYLEMMERLSARPDAPQSIKDDFNTIMEWFGITPAEWSGMTLEEKRPLHEQFAESFELWTLEGQAPTEEMQPIFFRFKAWMTHVYKSVENFLRTHPAAGKLNDEVRMVFSRMIASEEAIEEAQKLRSYAPLFKTKEEAVEAGVSESDYTKHVEQDKQATQDAVEAMQQRSIRDIRWLSNAKSAAVRKLQGEARAARKAILAEVLEEVASEPLNQARRFLRTGMVTDPATGENIKAEEGFRLNTDALAEMYPETMLARPDLSKLRGMTSKDGLHPDAVAAIFGYPSGEALVRDLLEGESMKSKVAGLVDQRMLERHGELVDPKAIERAAELSIHNQARARFLATGLKILTKSTIPARQLLKAAKEAALSSLAGKKIKDIRPKQYAAAEGRANKEALRNVAKDPAAAIKAQRAALLNNQLAKASLDALEEVRKGIEKMKRLTTPSAQSRMRGENLLQMNALLARFDLRVSTTNAQLERAQSLRDYLASEAERLSAVMPDVPSWLLDETLTPKSYKDMTLEEFRGLLDAVKALEHLARREEHQYQAIRNQTFAEERASILLRLREVHPEIFDPETGDVLPITPDLVPSVGKTLGEIKDALGAEFMNAETIVNILEGGQFGALHESLLGRISKRSDWKSSKLSEIYQYIKPFFDAYSIKEKFDFSRKEIGTFNGIAITRENAVVVALLHGNAEGRERLANYGWSEVAQRNIANLLTEKDVKLINAMWSLFDNTLWPELKELNERTLGKAPPKVRAMPYPTKSGIEATGGYFKLKYDSDINEAHRTGDEAVKELLGTRTGMLATTEQGSSQARVQGVKKKPRLDLGLFNEAVNETVHDLAFREAVADTYRLLNDASIQSAIKQAASVAEYRALVARVGDVAAKPRNPMGFVEKSATIARKNTVVTLMSGLATALQNFTGFIPAVGRVNPARLTAEVAKFFSPIMVQRYAVVMDKSEYMRNRFNQFDRSLYEEGKSLTIKGKIMPSTASWLWFMRIADRGVSVPLWLAAYGDGMAKFANDEEKAIDFADHVVRQTQGSGRDVDVPQIMARGPVHSLFMMFYSYANGQLNMLIRAGAISRQMAATNPAKATALFVRDFMLVMVLPAVVTVMFQSLIGGMRGDDEEDDTVLHKYGTALGMYGLSMVPLVRDVGSFAWKKIDPDLKDFGYKITPVESAVEGVVLGALSLWDVVIGQGDDADTRNLIMGTSFAIGLPGVAIRNAWLGGMAWLEGETGPQGILFGAPRN